MELNWCCSGSGHIFSNHREDLIHIHILEHLRRFDKNKKNINMIHSAGMESECTLLTKEVQYVKQSIISFVTLKGHYVV